MIWDLKLWILTFYLCFTPLVLCRLTFFVPFCTYSSLISSHFILFHLPYVLETTQNPPISILDPETHNKQFGKWEEEWTREFVNEQSINNHKSEQEEDEEEDAQGRERKKVESRVLTNIRLKQKVNFRSFMGSSS